MDSNCRDKDGGHKDSPTEASSGEYSGLCFRCEHRAEFLERGIRPRYECGEIWKAKGSCYMFLPVRPLLIEKSSMSDPRPITLNIFSCRVKRVGIGDVWLQTRKTKKGILVFWVPKKRMDTKL